MYAFFVLIISISNCVLIIVLIIRVSNTATSNFVAVWNCKSLPHVAVDILVRMLKGCCLYIECRQQDISLGFGREQVYAYPFLKWSLSIYINYYHTNTQLPCSCCARWRCRMEWPRWWWLNFSTRKRVRELTPFWNSTLSGDSVTKCGLGWRRGLSRFLRYYWWKNNLQCNLLQYAISNFYAYYSLLLFCFTSLQYHYWQNQNFFQSLSLSVHVVS